MKSNDFRELSVDELRGKEAELAEEIFHSRLKLKTGEVENTAKIKIDRRDLARVKTVLSEKLKAEAK